MLILNPAILLLCKMIYGQSYSLHHYLLNHKIRNGYVHQQDMAARADKKNEADLYSLIRNYSKDIRQKSKFKLCIFFVYRTEW